MPVSKHDLHVKRVYDEPKPADGARILVDRLWPRGLSKADAKLTHWLKDVAPSTELRMWFGHIPARWHEFQKRYTAQLTANPDAVFELEKYWHQGTVTLLYGAKDELHNHAIVLADFLREHRR
jgi:uncharacterized protein YeaO (DUF488 family)